MLQELSSQLLTYLALAAAGFIVVAWSLLFGGHDHDAHIDHSHGDHGHDGGNVPAVSIFSPKVLAAFVLGFGVGGAIATLYGFGALASVLSGLAAGLVVGLIALLALRLLYGQQSSSTLLSGEAVGKTGRVTIEAPASGLGEVEVSVRGSAQTYSASSDSGEPIPRGALVRVAHDVGGTLSVRPV